MIIIQALRRRGGIKQCGGGGVDNCEKGGGLLNR